MTETPASQRTILLVEDQALIALDEQRVLQKSGFIAHIVHTGERAVEVIEEHPEYDLVLMDIDLGRGIDGTEAARRILDRRRLPIVFLTAHVEREYVERVEKITSYGYVLKSSGEFVLIQSITMALKLFDAHRETREHEENLKNALDELQLAVDTAQLGIWRLDVDSDRLEWNDRMFQIYGVSREGFGGRLEWWKSLVHPNDLDGALHALMGVMEGDVVYDVEFRIVRPNGQERHLRASACPVTDGAGRPETLIGINIDVTEQKRRDERYRLLVENTGEAFTTVDLDGTVLMMNHAAAHDLGGEPEELVGRPLSEVCPADAACASLALLREVAQSGEGCEREWRLSAGDSVRWLEVRFRPVREDDGSVSSVLLLSSDITARKEAELAHARTESELQFIAENSLDVIAVFDSDLTPVYISPSAEEAFGYMPDELMEIDVRRAVHPHDLERLRGGIAETLKLKRTRGSRKARMYTKEGELRWFELRAHYVYDEDGEFDRVVVNARDVTERERMEEELRVALQEKGALMAEMNHRVKNNLSMVASLIRLKDQTLGECGDLSDIDRHVSAISLIHDRLYQANDTAEIMFGDFLDDLLSGTFALHSGPPVRVENEVGDALLLTKKAVILALIVNELAMNAVKHGFTREEPPVFRLSLRAEHERYSLAVYNSGRPFPDNVDLRTAGSLGLRLVSVLVDQLEGTIELQRRPHTEFTIRFPAD